LCIDIHARVMYEPIVMLLNIRQVSEIGYTDLFSVHENVVITP
jgi:hypothetical protein